MIQTTYNLLRQARACTDGYSKFRKHIGDVGDDTPIDLHRACDSNSVQDILWALQYATLGPRPDRLLRELACDFAEHVLPLFEARYPEDKRLRRAIEVARCYARGEAALDELELARRDADAAAEHAADAVDAAYAAAKYAAYTAVEHAAYAAYAAAEHAAYAAYAAAKYAAYARRSADAAAERAWQLSHLRATLLVSLRDSDY